MENLCTAPAVTFQQPGADASDVELPRAARIELLERHKGPKRGFAGVDSILVPNLMRINGVTVFATYDNPAVIREIAVDGSGLKPFLVQVQLLARALKVGGTPAYEARAEGGDLVHGVVVEIPGVEQLEPGTEMPLPWVLLNGHRLYVEGQVVIGELATRSPIQNTAVVTLTLLCRQLIVDDEPLGESEA
jgi:hypothetical protein